MSRPFLARDLRIYRPYPDEVPWELLAETGVADPPLLDSLERNLLRVGKLGERVAGCYAIRPQSPVRYQLVTLIVAETLRRQGLGRWLLGHAIGLAETKGGREVVTRRPGTRAAERFLAGMGFVPDGDGWLQLTLIPE